MGNSENDLTAEDKEEMRKVTAYFSRILGIGTLDSQATPLTAPQGKAPEAASETRADMRGIGAPHLGF